MRTVVESKQVLVVETRGWLMPVVFAAIVLIHILAAISPLSEMMRRSREGTAMVVIVAAVFTYWLLGYLVFGPLADRRIITFHGLNRVLGIEWAFPFGIKFEKEHPFSTVQSFVLAPPEGRGFCAVRFVDGRMQRLLRVRTDRDYGILERLGEITRKKLEKL